MAFRDITRVLYDGKIKLDYKDKAHRYYVRERINFDLPEENAKAWGKVIYPKGTTTLLGDTLEKKGLLKYALTKALMYWWGFYEFTDDAGEKKIGYSQKGVGSLWGSDGKMIPFCKEEAIEHISYGAHASDRHTKQGADIGSIVHDAIQHFIEGNEFDIAEQYAWNIKEAEYDSEKLREQAMEEFDDNVAMATKAFLRFQKWWLTINPELHSAEDLLYSMEHNVCGTYDGDISIEGKHHPVERFKNMEKVRITADWKTSNASKSKEAASPEGVYYSYFIQLAIYELMRREMGMPPADDLLTVSARKDGEFSLVYASELGFTVERCIKWAVRVIEDNLDMREMKAALLEHANASEVGENNKDKEEF